MAELLESEIVQTLRVADTEARYDAAARKLVAQKAILAYILKSTLDEFADVPVKQIADQYIEGTPQISEIPVHQDHPDGNWPPKQDLNGKSLNGDERIKGMPTEDTSIREGTVRYDIRFHVCTPKADERMEIIVNIEIQNNDTPGYAIPQRGIYYGSRLISAQRCVVFKDQEYDKIKKVVSIWICEDTAMKRSDTINEYRIAERCRRGDYQEPPEDYDLMRVVVMRLGIQGEKSEDDAIRLLSKIFSPTRSAKEKEAILENEFHIEITSEVSREVHNVCNLSAGIYNKGKQEGRREGRQEGRREGRQEGGLEMLFRLVKENLITASVAAQQANMEQSVFEKKYRAYLQ